MTVMATAMTALTTLRGGPRERIRASTGTRPTLRATVMAVLLVVVVVVATVAVVVVVAVAGAAGKAAGVAGVAGKEAGVLAGCSGTL
jgi:sterol desaturase/sphingolipid hydroxylase (fatty acid hydroxylase superfamily)